MQKKKCPSPPPARLSEVRPGCYVKKCFRGGVVRSGPYVGTRVVRECVWIKVKKVRRSGFEGTVANEPIASKAIRYGQRVVVRRSEVVQATCRMPGG